MKSRIYVVGMKSGGDPILVRAVSQAQALASVADAKVASQDQIADLCSSGMKVLDATKVEVPKDPDAASGESNKPAPDLSAPATASAAAPAGTKADVATAAKGKGK